LDSAAVVPADASTGSGIESNLAENHRRLENAPLEEVRSKAERGNAEAQYQLGRFCYSSVNGGEAEAAIWYRKAADQGHAHAQFEIGECYADGTGVAKDEVEAVKWFRKAADQGGVWAQYKLGKCYENGTGISTDAIEAVKWYRKAAEPGDLSPNPSGFDGSFPTWAIWNARAEAQRALAQCYSNGVGVVEDRQEAARWSLEAHRSHGESDRAHLDEIRALAEKGDAHWQRTLAGYYKDGDYIESKNPVEAVKWYRKAAEQGDELAQNQLGLIYYYGELGETNRVEAAKWFRRAAEQGTSTAQAFLGSFYMTGDGGLLIDFLEAFKWSTLATQDRQFQDPLARLNLSLLARAMTPGQISEGQRLVREFRARKAPQPGAQVSAKEIVDSNPAASGTGFFVAADGFLITNKHVVKEAGQIRLVTPTGLFTAKLVRADKANDLALLKTEGKFAPLAIAASATVHLGATVATIGFPNPGLQGFTPKFAKGEISALSGGQDDPRFFQISTPLQPGNSGGALVDEHGNVVGVVSAKLDAAAALASSGALPENVNYAVKSSFLLGFLESVPDVSAKLKAPSTKEQKFPDVVKAAQDAAVLVLVY
jgi:TPR repeat protein